MKSIYRLIRILSCALVIATVLLCSIFVPVMAVSNVYQPKDYNSRIEYEGNNEIVYYNFDVAPYFSVLNQANGVATNDYGSVFIENVNSQKRYVFRIYPLGQNFVPGSSISSGVIDIRDFKSKAVFNFEASVNFNIQYAYKLNAAGTTNFYFLSSVYFCFYDADGGFISQVSSSDIRYDVKLISALLEGTGEEYVLDISAPMQIPENAVYMAPCILSYLYPPDQNADHLITRMDCDTKGFHLFVSKNLLIEQSETLEAINDKADELLTGSDEMQGASDDFSGTADNAQQDMDSALDQLEDLPEANPDDVDMTFDGLLSDKGFQKYANFFEFLVLDTLYVKMMVIVCTFIWVSTLLYGKRG